MTVLTISIPAYNDAPTIRAVVDQSIAAASQCTTDFQILLINDGSQDDTQAVIDEICRTRSNVRALSHAKNLGFGPTIREAYLAADSEWVVFLPGDGQIPPSQVVVLFQHTGAYDLILGYRIQRRDPWNRRLTSWCYNRMVSFAAGRRIHDVNGTALIRRNLLDRVSLGCDSAFVHAEIVLKSIAAGATYREVEIEHLPREYGTGSGNKLSVIFPTFRDLVGYIVSAPFVKSPPSGRSS